MTDETPRTLDAETEHVLKRLRLAAAGQPRAFVYDVVSPRGEWIGTCGLRSAIEDGRDAVGVPVDVPFRIGLEPRERGVDISATMWPVRWVAVEAGDRTVKVAQLVCPDGMNPNLLRRFEAQAMRFSLLYINGGDVRRFGSITLPQEATPILAGAVRDLRVAMPANENPALARIIAIGDGSYGLAMRDMRAVDLPSWRSA